MRSMRKEREESLRKLSATANIKMYETCFISHKRNSKMWAEILMCSKLSVSPYVLVHSGRLSPIIDPHFFPLK